MKQDPSSREGVVSSTSVLGIAVNLLISILKVIVGVLASSIAIISEGVNNAADALTSTLTLVGTKLAGKHPDEKHPFGYGRIEYLTSLVISVLIIITGAEMLFSSIKLISAPEELNVSYLSLIVVAVSAVIKFFLGVYTIRKGKSVGSTSLEAVGLDCRNDSFASIVTLLSAAVFLIFGFSIDAYAGIFTSILILKAGIEVLIETVSELIGRPGEEELASRLYKEIRATPGIINAVDMMLHNYGPDRYSGSVNVEIDHEVSVGEAYSFLHELQLRIMHDFNVVMVFGLYAVDNDHEEVRNVRNAIATYVQSHDHVLSYHAVYLEPGTEKLYCDLIVDYQLKDWESLRLSFSDYMNQRFPDKAVILTIETEYV